MLKKIPKSSERENTQREEDLWREAGRFICQKGNWPAK